MYPETGFSGWDFLCGVLAAAWALPVWCKIVLVLLIVVRIGWPSLIWDGSGSGRWHRRRRRRRYQYDS